MLPSTKLKGKPTEWEKYFPIIYPIRELYPGSKNNPCNAIMKR